MRLRGKISLTNEIARAAGMDAGNESMRKAGRNKWNLEDYNAAAEVTGKLLAEIYRASLREQKLKCGHTMEDWVESGMGYCGKCHGDR